MTFSQELTSWLSPKSLAVSAAPEIGKQAPSTAKLKIPDESGKPLIVTFLRHCGCPFAEKTYLTMRTAAISHPSISFLAISHSSPSSTSKWLQALPAPPAGAEAPNLTLLVDDSRDLYARWGLGISSFWHVLNPTSLGALGTLKKSEGIAVRETESGNRWQTAGTWAVDAEGVVRWGGAATSAEQTPDFNEAVGAVTRK